jgi:hypothetical protein
MILFFHKKVTPNVELLYYINYTTYGIKTPIKKPVIIMITDYLTIVYMDNPANISQA